MARVERDGSVASTLLHLVRSEAVDLGHWEGDSTAAADLVQQVDFHRLGFQLVDATGSAGSELAARGTAGGAVLAGYLRTTTVRRTFLDRLARAALDFVADALATADVPWCVIKGPALLTYAPNGDTRDYRDLDILVAGERLAETVAALEAAGAVLVDRNFAMLAEVVSGELTLVLDNGFPLDLHWHPIHTTHTRQAFRLDSAALVARSKPALGGRFPFPVLDHDDNLLYVAAHAGLTGGYRLLWTRDVIGALRYSQWDAGTVVQRAHDSGTALLTAVVLDDVAALTGDVDAMRLADLLAPRSAWRALMRRARAGERSRGGSRRPSWGLSRSTRATAAGSAAEYVAGSVRRARGRSYVDLWGQRSDRASVADLRREVDGGARDRYFAAVRAESRRASDMS